MTLQKFRALTEGMPPSTPILYLSPWGELDPAAIVTAGDLVPGDPLIDDIPPGSIVLAGDADLAERETLPA